MEPQQSTSKAASPRAVRRRSHRRWHYNPKTRIQTYASPSGHVFTIKRENGTMTGLYYTLWLAGRCIDHGTGVSPLKWKAEHYETLIKQSQ